MSWATGVILIVPDPPSRHEAAFVAALDAFPYSCGIGFGAPVAEASFGGTQVLGGLLFIGGFNHLDPEEFKAHLAALFAGERFGINQEQVQLLMRGEDEHRFTAYRLNEAGWYLDRQEDVVEYGGRW